MTRSPSRLIPADFSAVPSLGAEATVTAVTAFAADLDAVVLLVGAESEPPASIGLGRDALAAAGFTAEPGSS
ncbi:MAG: hypothetical protein WAL91_06295, partial [Propionicimonas sp.]